MSDDAGISEEFARHLGDEHQINTQDTFDRILQTRDKAFEMIRARLPLVEDMHCADIHEFNDLDGNQLGRMRNFTGPECHVDWVIHSNIGHPKNTFTNIHLTFWMKGTTDVPHLGLAFGTLPEVFFYVDLMPRYEIVTNPEHCHKYYDPLNKMHMDFRSEMREAGHESLVPNMPFIRSSLSPCVIAGVTPEDFYVEHAEQKILDLVEYWIGLVENAENIKDPEMQKIFTDRDTKQRKTIVYLDPANPIAARLVGQTAADRLVRILAGEERGSAT